MSTKTEKSLHLQNQCQPKKKAETWRRKIGELITRSKPKSEEERFLLADEVLYIVERTIQEAKEETLKGNERYIQGYKNGKNEEQKRIISRTGWYRQWLNEKPTNMLVEDKHINL